jgi:nitrogen fixation protein NifX
MKIAFATQDLKRVDAHFGWAKNIAIYEISPEGHQFLEAIQFEGDLQEDGNEDKLAPKLDAIADCAILYVAAIGGSIAFGSALGVVVAGPIFEATHVWQTTCGILSIVGWIALVVALYVVFVKKPGKFESTHYTQESTGEQPVFKRVLSKPIFYVAMLAAFCEHWAFLVLWNMSPAFISVDKPIGLGFGPVVSGQFSLATMIAGIIGPIIGGWMLVKLFKGNPRPVIMLGFLIAGIFTYLIVVPFVNSTAAILVIALLLASAFDMMVNPSLAAFNTKAHPHQIVGRVHGITMGFGALGGFIGMAVSSMAIAQTHSLGSPLMIAAIVAIVGLVLAGFLVVPKGQEAPSDQSPSDSEPKAVHP